MSKECMDCDSTSMEVCLLQRHCPHWFGGNRGDKQTCKGNYAKPRKHIKDSTELSGGKLW